MLKRFKKQWAIFRDSRPGTLFEEWHQRSRRSPLGKGGGWRIFRITGSIVCFIFGVIASIVPGLPGVFFVLIGAALLATESLEIARSFDWCEMKLRALWNAVRRRCESAQRARRHS